MENLDEELDRLSFRMIQLMKEYIEMKLTLEEQIKSGSLHLAKSRYIMGNRSVSVLQLPTEDSELVASKKLTESRSSDSVDQLCFELMKTSLEDTAVASNKKENVQLKRRNVPESSSEPGAASEGNADAENRTDKDNKKKEKFGNDPLKWFGVLLPQNMRLAQAKFNEAIELVVQCANLQLEIHSVKNLYKETLTKKKKCKEQSVESDPISCSS